MRTIYIDSENHCHVTATGVMTAAETDFFDGKCDTFVEGYCFDIEKGAVYPWNPVSELDAAQRDYERQLLEEYKATIADMENALNKLGVTLDG